MKKFWHNYKHSFMLLYFPVYLIWFFRLENRTNDAYHVIHTGLDEHIPFLEYFIVPYLLWFAYVAVVFCYLFFRKDTREFYQYCCFLFTGMTLFLIISTVYPNGHLLRPGTFKRENIFTQAVSLLYQADTATNIFPSIHVYNSIAAHMAVIHNQKLHNSTWIRRGSLLLMISIILSTVFLKQHSILDLIAGAGLGYIMNQLIYNPILTKQYFPYRRKTYSNTR